MAWFRVDDQSTFHVKVMNAGNAAYGAWVRMGCYCNSHLTDGTVPDRVADMIASKKELEKLCAVKLAERVDGGYQIHDYLEYQPSKEEVIRRKAELTAKRSEAGRIGGKASGNQRRSKPEANGEANSKQLASTDRSKSEAPSHPIPSVSERERDHADTPAWFQDAWKLRAKMLMVTPSALLEPWRLTYRYAIATKQDPAAAAQALFDAFDEVQSQWTVKVRWATHLFVKHFESIQQIAARTMTTSDPLADAARAEDAK